MKCALFGCEQKWNDVTELLLKHQDSKDSLIINSTFFGVNQPNKLKFLKITRQNKDYTTYTLENEKTTFSDLWQPPIGDMKVLQKPFVTFIIPSIGRSTLQNTIDSTAF